MAGPEYGKLETDYDDGETCVYACCLDSDTDIPLSDALSCLNETEKGRMQRFVFPRDRTRFARSRGFLRHCLSRHLNVSAAAISLEYEPNGKPVVHGADIAFNLSHSEGIAVVAVSNTSAIGIDLELSYTRFRQNSNLLELGQHCFVEAELGALAVLPQEEQRTRFLRYWTAKEARMKLWGDGFALDPRKIELRLVDGNPVGFRHDPDVRLQFVQFGDDSVSCCYARSLRH